MTLFGARSGLLAILLLTAWGAASTQAAPQATTPAPPPNQAKPKWEGYQDQLLDEPLTPFKPLHPRTQEEQNRIEALAWYGVGNLELLRNNNEIKAFAAFQKAFEYDPQSIPLLNQLVLLSFRNGKQEEAYKYLLKLVELSPTDSSRFLRQLAEFLVNNDDIPGAIRLYEKAAQSPNLPKNSPLQVLLMKELGILYKRTNRIPEAATCFEILFDALQNYDKYHLDARVRREITGDPKARFEDLGEVFLAADKLDLAQQAFEKAAAKGGSSKQAELSYNLARVFVKKKEPAQALEQIEKHLAGKLHAKGRGAYELLAEVLKSLGRESELIPKLEKIAADHQDNSTLQYFLADQYLAAGRLPEAETIIRKTLAENRNQMGYLSLAKVDRMQGKYLDYVEDLGKAYADKKDLGPFDSEFKAVQADAKVWDGMWAAVQPLIKEKSNKLDYPTIYVLVQTAIKAGKTEPAQELVTYALALKRSQAAQLYEDLADHLADVKRFKDAGKFYQQGAEDPAASDRRWNLFFQASQAYELGGETDTALKMIQQARKVMDHPANTFQEGWIYSHAGNYDEAIKRLEQVIKSDNAAKPLIRTALMTLSNVYVQKGDMRKGEEILEKILEESPEDPSVNNDLGYLYADQSKNLEQAEKMITKALKAEPDKDAYLDSMGWVLYRRGKAAERLPYLIKASKTSLDSGDATIWEHLGDVYNALKQTSEAGNSWKKALELAKSAPKQDKKLIDQLESKLKQMATTTPPPKTP
ncbi:MAG: tetratricopeptide repeat protein [Planctomycetales bacterium]